MLQFAANLPFIIKEFLKKNGVLVKADYWLITCMCIFGKPKVTIIKHSSFLPSLNCSPIPHSVKLETHNLILNKCKKVYIFDV